MKIVLIRFMQRAGAKSNIPWHYSFFKDILTAHGHYVDILDNQVQNRSMEELVRYIVQEEYELVGTGGIGTVYNCLKEFCFLMKTAKPEIKIIVGGHITADHTFLINNVNIDIIIRGEGEVTLAKLVEAFEHQIDWKAIPGIAYRDGRSVVETKPEEPVLLDDLPDFNFENIDIDSYNTSVPNEWLVDARAKTLKNNGDKYLPVYLARGCPYHCFFCYRHMRGYRTYSFEKLDSLLSGLKTKGFSFFSFGDECITASKKNLKNICELSKKHEIYWMTSGRVDHITSEVLRMLKNHNCIGLQFGVESFDQDMLNVMNKGTSVEQNIKVMNLCYQYGLRTVLQLIIGSPGEDRNTILNTRKGMWQCFFMVDRIACAILNPYPGSPAYYYGLDKGQIKDKELLHREVDSKGKIVINFSKLSKTELYTWQRWLHLEAALSFRVKHRKLLLSRRFLHLWARFAKMYLSLVAEPLNFVLFNVYIAKGYYYWLRPTKRI